MEPLPSINRVFSLAQQQERQLMGGGEISESKPIVNNINNQESKFHGNEEAIHGKCKEEEDQEIMESNAASAIR